MESDSLLFGYSHCRRVDPVIDLSKPSTPLQCPIPTRLLLDSIGRRVRLEQFHVRAAQSAYLRQSTPSRSHKALHPVPRPGTAMSEGEDPPPA